MKLARGPTQEIFAWGVRAGSQNEATRNARLRYTLRISRTRYRVRVEWSGERASAFGLVEASGGNPACRWDRRGSGDVVFHHTAAPNTGPFSSHRL